MTLNFFANGDHSDKKALSQFWSFEERLFDSLDNCCREKFPQNTSECCEAGGSCCPLSGNLKFILNFDDRAATSKIETRWRVGSKHFSKILSSSAVSTTCIMMWHPGEIPGRVLKNNWDLGNGISIRIPINDIFLFVL
jgi:hypothetical protein